MYAFEHHDLGVVTIDHDEVYRGGTLRVICQKGASLTSLNERLSQQLQEERAVLFGEPLRSIGSELERASRCAREERYRSLRVWRGTKSLHAVELAEC